jgi:gamma-glutamyltranspeptidase/glutathione hydrolase
VSRAFDRPGRSPVIAENGLAATSHPLATQTAISVLKAGGNAVDAAIAASATLCVVEPAMTGIGGDCFAIVAEPDGSIHGLNGSGRAASRVDAGWYRENGFAEIPETGPLAVTVPGAVKAWETLLGRFGTRGFDTLFADATRYAEEGFAVHQRVAWDWRRYVADLSADEAGARHCLIDGRAPREGERVRFPALGRTLRTIATGGAKALYEGEMAAEIAATVQGLGGFLHEDDLAAVTADWVDPVNIDYRGVHLLEIPPNGQGITALIQLGILDRIAPLDAAPLSAERLHALIEAGRLAYSVRDHLVADPVTMTTEVETLLSSAFAADLASRFDSRSRNEDLSLPKMPKSSTIYLTVADRDGRIVSFINSLYSGFGSKVVTPRSGIVLQNRGACFTLEEGHPNEIGPGKRPMHTIIPAMVLKDGRPWMSYGVMGGDYQPMGHVHVLSNMIDHGMDPQEAVDHPRIFWGEDRVLDAESGMPDDTLAALEKLGHRTRRAARPHGGAQVIVVDRKNGFFVGASDPRKDGCAMGW